MFHSSIKIVLVALLGMPAVLFSQNNDSLRAGKMSIGLLFSPDLCDRIIINSPSYQYIADKRNKEEVAKFGFSAGIAINYRLNKRFLIESGIMYSNKGFQTKKTDLIWVTPDPSFPTKSKTIYNYRYFDIPLKVNYYVINKKFKFFISAGMSFNIFIGKQTIVKEYYESAKKEASGKYNKTLGFSKWNFVPLLGLGVEYELSQKFRLKLEPIARYSLTPTSPDLSIEDHLYSLGLNCGIYYNFKKKVRN